MKINKTPSRAGEGILKVNSNPEVGILKITSPRWGNFENWELNKRNNLSFLSPGLQLQVWFLHLMVFYLHSAFYQPKSGVHIISSNTIPNVDWLILGAEITHVVIVNNWKYEVWSCRKIPNVAKVCFCIM